VAIVAQYVDSYGQRYVTTRERILNEFQYVTKTYIPFVYGEEIVARRLEDSIEVYGIINTTVQVFEEDDSLVVENFESEKAWIEVWRRCSNILQSDFKYTLDCSIITVVEHDVSFGPAFVDPEGNNETYWSDIDTNGNFLPNSIPNSSVLEWIDLWSD